MADMARHLRHGRGYADHATTRGFTLGIIGSGDAAASIAHLAAANGLRVVLSDPSAPEALARLVEQLGPLAEASGSAEVAAVSDLVVICVPLSANRSLPEDLLVGKVVVDAANDIAESENRITGLERSAAASSAVLQRRLAWSRVVKALNTIDAARMRTLARPRGARDRSALPICGDNGMAKETVSSLVDVLGFDTLDIGPLSESWRIEPGMPAYVRPYVRAADAAARQARGQPGTPVLVTVSELRRLVGAAEKNRRDDAARG